jgi:metallo-beta-lactamase family protein
MKISFHGACREVTGSCILIEAPQQRFLVDCGIFQGEHFVSGRNFEPFKFNPEEIDFVLLTHAHMDHCGRLPKLFADGFRGKVYCTAATKDLTELMLLDSANIISREAAQFDHEPLYKESDVTGIISNFVTLPYDETTPIEGLRVRLRDAGHILGSTIFEVWVKDGDKEKKMVFTGDLGNSPSPIIRDFEFIDGADYVCIESTYAGRYHESKKEGRQLMRNAVVETVAHGGTLMIPIFALEKVQEILFELNYLVENKLVPFVPVFLDSPLAISALAVYKEYQELYNVKSRLLLKTDRDIFGFRGLELTKTSAESKKINLVRPPKIILAGSGMCTGGRIPYHLEHNLNDPNSQLLFVSYLVPGSLGRKLLDGEKSVIIENYAVHVRAKISAIGCYSSHADQLRLMQWLKTIVKPYPKKVFVIHGELESNEILAKDASKQLGLETMVPEYGQVYDI